MKILWLIFVLHTAYAQPGFGRSYLRNSRLCHQWSCITRELGLSDSLPTAEEFGTVLRRLLPEDWREAVGSVLHTCYHDRPRRYSNTCPGQAIFHCAVDQLIQNCPEQHLRKKDACAPVSSIAGFKIMFTQSRYEDLESNMNRERRPSWFLTNYFDQKCCNLPQVFAPGLLSTCNFTAMMQYYVHSPQIKQEARFTQQHTAPVNNGDSLQIVSLNTTTVSDDSNKDPLECCDMSDFISSSNRQECDFTLTWGQNRLDIKQDGVNGTQETTTSRPTSPIRRDLIVVPQSCEKEACVFTKLNVITENGTIDVNAFTKLLDNLTNSQPSWTSAKGRVVTTCLRKPITEYQEKCEINNLLACTFDVLTENCPNATKDDLCKHSTSDRICQISTSKYRPKNRRSTCILPELVDRSFLTECGLNSLSKVKLAETPSYTRKYNVFTQYKCQDLTPSTSCALSKMGVLNKYGFTDYFKMKDHIRHFASQNEWSQLVNLYLDSFTSGPLYREHCNSPRKLLNVIDTMLLTCPSTRRKNTEQCTAMFTRIANTAVTNIAAGQKDQIFKHFHNTFFSTPFIKPNKLNRPKYAKLVRKPIYNYGILGDKYAPKVEIIDVKPKPVERKPLVLLPVYMRIPHSNLLVRPIKEDGIMRTAFGLNNNFSPVSSKIQSEMTLPK